MKTFLLIKNNDSSIPGDFVIQYRGNNYPISKKSNEYFNRRYPNGLISATFSDIEICLLEKPRRAKIGDDVHISRIPLAQVTEELGNCKDLNGIIIESSNDTIVVQLTNCGLSAKTLILHRNDVVIKNVSNTHKVGYMICKECGTKL